MPLDRDMSLKVSGLKVPGTVLVGYRAMDPELEASFFKLPGLNATRVITLGLKGRPIIVPMLVFDPKFTSYEKIADLFRLAEKKKAEGKQVSIEVPNVEGAEKFEKCLFVSCEVSPAGYKKDEAGTLDPQGRPGRVWFCDATFVFFQVQAVK